MPGKIQKNLTSSKLKTILCPYIKWTKKKIKFFNVIENKMKDTISFENIVKLTKFSKFIKHIVLEEYQIQIYDLCPYKKIEGSLYTQSEKSKLLCEGLKKKDNKVDKRLYEYLDNANSSQAWNKRQENQNYTVYF